MWSSVASVWVWTFEVLFSRPTDTQVITDDLNMSKMMQELENADAKICAMETSMERKIHKLTNEAVMCKACGDMIGARKKLQERKTVSGHIEKLRSSQNIISLNLFSVRNAELNKSLVSTLKATGNAMKILVPHEVTDIKQVEDVMFDLEDHVKRSREVDDVLSRPVTSDTMTGCDDIDLELELLQTGDEESVYKHSDSTFSGVSTLPMVDQLADQPRDIVSSEHRSLYTKKPLPEIPSVSFRPRTGDEMDYMVYN